MARYRGPIAKISRRLNIALTEKAQKVLNKRPFPPGQHGPSARRRQMSDYGTQLQEKQKARYMYGLLEKQFRNLYSRAQRVPGETGAALFMLRRCSTLKPLLPLALNGPARSRWAGM